MKPNRPIAWMTILGYLLPMAAAFAPAREAQANPRRMSAAQVDSKKVERDLECEGICEAIVPDGEWTEKDDQFCVNYGEQTVVGMMPEPDAAAPTPTPTGAPGVRQPVQRPVAGRSGQGGCPVQLRQADINRHNGNISAACQEVNRKLLHCKFKDSQLASHCMAKKFAKKADKGEKWVLALDAAAATACTAACVAGNTHPAGITLNPIGKACATAGALAATGEIIAAIRVGGGDLGTAVAAAGGLVGLFPLMKRGADLRRGPSSFEAEHLLRPGYRHFVEPTLMFFAAVGELLIADATASTGSKTPSKPSAPVDSRNPGAPNTLRGGTGNFGLDAGVGGNVDNGRLPDPIIGKRAKPLPKVETRADAPKPAGSRGSNDGGLPPMDWRSKIGVTPSGNAPTGTFNVAPVEPAPVRMPASGSQGLDGGPELPPMDWKSKIGVTPSGNAPTGKFNVAPVEPASVKLPEGGEQRQVKRPASLEELEQRVGDDLRRQEKARQIGAKINCLGLQGAAQHECEQRASRSNADLAAEKKSQQEQARKDKRKAACSAAIIFSALTGVRALNSLRAKKTEKEACDTVKKLYSDALTVSPGLPSPSNLANGAGASSATAGGSGGSRAYAGARSSVGGAPRDGFAEDLPLSEKQALMSAAVDGNLLKDSGLDRLVEPMARKLNPEALVRAAEGGTLGSMLGAASGGSQLSSTLGGLSQVAFRNPPNFSLDRNVAGAMYAGVGGGRSSSPGASPAEPQMPDLAALMGGGEQAMDLGGPERSIAFEKPQDDDIWHSNTDQNLFQIVSGRIEKSAPRLMPPVFR